MPVVATGVRLHSRVLATIAFAIPSGADEKITAPAIKIQCRKANDSIAFVAAGIEVTLPANLLAGSKEIQRQWVDRCRWFVAAASSRRS